MKIQDKMPAPGTIPERDPAKYRASFMQRRRQHMSHITTVEITELLKIAKDQEKQVEALQRKLHELLGRMGEQVTPTVKPKAPTK